MPKAAEIAPYSLYPSWICKKAINKIKAAKALAKYFKILM